MRPFKIDRMMHLHNPRIVDRQATLGWMRCVLALLALVGSAFSTLAQVDTVEVRIWGGQQDDRGVRLIQLADGDLLSLSSTNSTSTNQPQAWVQRIDSNAHVVWESTLSDSPLLQPVDAVEHEDGRITVLSMRYASAADGYDWHWQSLAPDGTPQGSQLWGTPAWDLPLRCFDRSGELWTVGTTYASGSGDVQWTRHVWADENWMLSDAAAWGTEQEEVVTDALIVGDTLLVSATLEAEQRASLTAYDLISGETTWTYSSVWDEPTSSVALDARDTTVVGLMNVETADGIRLAFVCLSLSGDTLLEKIPGSGVDVEAYDLQWYSDGDFATISMTEGLGLGGEELLFSRWSAENGAWQGGPTFGTPWDERPASMLCDASNRIWVLGRTDGYSNGRDDVYLLQFPDASIGDYLGNVETNILETTLSIEADAIQANAGWQVFPNPVSALFEIRGYRSGQRWTVFDSWGRKLAEGQGSRVDASQWPVGMLWLVPSNSDNTRTMRALKLNVVR